MPSIPKSGRGLRRDAPTSQSTEVLASRDNRWLKTFRAALQHSGPPEGEWVGIEGPRLVAEALQSGLDISAVLLSPAGEQHLQRLGISFSNGLAAAHTGFRILRTTDRLFSSVTGTQTPQGVAALVRPRACTFDDLLRGDTPLVVALVEVQDPGNVGTVIRSAEAFGATGAIATRGTAHPWAPKAMRASAGSAMRLPILSGMAAPVVLGQLRVTGLKLYAAGSGEDALPPSDADLRVPCALLIGNEGAGLPPAVERAADARLRIPLAAAVDSLNAAIAASVLLYEAARQRRRQC